MSLIETLLVFVFVLGIVIVVHEGGHFLVAKAVGIYVKTFSVGFGPKLLRRRIGQTEYAISAVPFGGYVKMAGEGLMEEIQDTGAGEEDVDGSLIPEEQYFSSKTPLQRLAVVVAGPLMNLLLALVVMIGVIYVKGLPVVPGTTVGEVETTGAAAEAGLQTGDRIVSIAGEPVASWNDVDEVFYREFVADRLPVAMTVERDGLTLPLYLAPEKDAETGKWQPVGLDYHRDTRVGKVKKDGPAHEAGLRRGDRILTINGEEMHDYSQVARIVNESIDEPLELTWSRQDEIFSATVIPERAEVPVDLKTVRTLGRIYYEPFVEYDRVGFGEAVRLGSRYTWRIVDATASFLRKLVSGGASRDAVSGPIRIGQFAGEMFRWGFDRLMEFIALFSVNLFLLNLLPIPVLDGGHAVFILYELVARRRPNERVQLIATQVGFVLLLLIMAFVITMDVIKVAS